VPALAQHLAANAAPYAIALAAEDSGVVAYVNVHAGRFMREIASSLKAGFVITIDYGDTTWRLVQGARRGAFPFRVYGHQQDFVPRPNDPYAFPGTQDMTADVNFTDLARAGEQAGLDVIHFGPERDLVDDLPALLRAAARDDNTAEFLGNPVFKVLVLGTGPTEAFSGPLTSPLPLAARAQDVPKRRRPRIASVENRLTQLAR
jgi:SAM-dependent MidA family methyltransferase